MNEELKSRILYLLKHGLRLDGRKPYEYRPIDIEQGIISTAEGSARVKIGNTEVLAGVKFSIMEPFQDKPDEGNLMVDVQLLPIASEHYEAGPPGINAIELARVTDRGIRESNMIDMKDLVIDVGEKVWGVGIDISTINVDGGLFDVCNLAAIAALFDARFPEFDGKKIDYKHKTDRKLKISKIPIGVTVYKIGDYYLIDPTEEEEQVADARLTVTSIDEKTIVAFQKGGYGALTEKDVMEMSKVAIAKAKELRELLIKKYGMKPNA